MMGHWAGAARARQQDRPLNAGRRVPVLGKGLGPWSPHLTGLRKKNDASEFSWKISVRCCHPQQGSMQTKVAVWGDLSLGHARQLLAAAHGPRGSPRLPSGCPGARVTCCTRTAAAASTWARARLAGRGGHPGQHQAMKPRHPSKKPWAPTSPTRLQRETQPGVTPRPPVGPSQAAPPQSDSR